MQQETNNLSAQQVTAIEEIVAQRLNEERESPADDYEFADVSASATVGPAGAHVKGWITYATAKIHFTSTSVEFSAGVFAGGGALPRMHVLRPNLIEGKVGTFLVEGAGFGASGGALNLWIDGRKVLGPLPLAGTGIGHFKAEGKLRFSREG